ncbi:transglycosylase domain-containing protein [Nocardiopsis suaedae]|uniref:Transglycosylase domain-containing protein n=1 Tax=Nocardiopsis suaedae TaxID=3018444 RepID=A0ABT4TN90_9ACTN|nr:transglycosylase domain-containing protein [Nocardiopsis suaedae]MDA2806163.1 transglycosylase domain-containing protein [Nocardiopsis suaedae]
MNKGRQEARAAAAGQRTPTWRRVLHWVLMTLSALVVAGAAAFTVAYALTPEPSELQPQGDAAVSASEIHYADGSKATSTGTVNRTKVSRDQIPDTVINGVLGAEQRNFYKTPGVSISGTTRAVLSGGEAGGGSTITQQMARNYYDGLSQERTYTRKIKEIFISLKVARRQSPDEIITQYLNTVYFGRNAYGVEAAAQAYFGKDVEDLDQAEGAFIGALIQRPSDFTDPEPGSQAEKDLHARWQYAVDGAVKAHEVDPEHGITQEEADSLEFPETIAWEPGASSSEPSEGYIRDAVVKELQNRYDLTDQQIATGGYEVQTSLDKDLMEAAGDAFTETLGEVPEGTVEGLAAVEPQTGEIKAFHGGSDPVNDTDNSLVQRAQAGSAFKPYALAAGLEDGKSLNSVYDGSSPQSFPGLTAPVRNDSGKSYGPVSLLEATENSVNTAYVGLTVDVGAQKVQDAAKAAGIPEKQFETAGLGPNIALGTYQVTALDQASGFATFANGGVHMPRHMVTGVEGAEGELTPEDAGKLETGTRAFGEGVAADATYAMEQVVDGGTGSSAALPDGRPAAGKTGTTDSAKATWFVGYTPQLSVAVGMSRADGQPLELPGIGAVYGGTTSALVWKDFMETAMEGRPVREFPEPVWGGGGGQDTPVQPQEPQRTQQDTPTREPQDTPTDEPTDEPTSDGGGDDGGDDGDGTESPDAGDGGDGGTGGGDGGTDDGGGDGGDSGTGGGDGGTGGGGGSDGGSEGGGGGGASLLDSGT